MKRLTLAIVLLTGCDVDPLELAMSTDYNTCPGDIPSDPAEAERAALEGILDHGYRIVSHRSVTARTNAALRTVSLQEAWASMSKVDRATTAWHEYTHVLTIAGEGPWVTVAAATEPDLRAAYEAIATRQSMWTAHAVGADRRDFYAEHFEDCCAHGAIDSEVVLDPDGACDQL